MQIKHKLAVGAALATTAGASMAQAAASGPDVSSIVTVIQGCGAAIASIGLAALAIHFGAKVYRWIRGAA